MSGLHSLTLQEKNALAVLADAVDRCRDKVSQQAETNRPFPFQERRQPFHRRAQRSADRDHDSRQPQKDRSPGGIHSCDTAPASTAVFR